MKKSEDTGQLATLDELRSALRQFAAERDWDQFHSPKNLAMALTVETAELLEHFQWLKEGTASELTLEKQTQIEEELADVLLYLVRLADKLEVDLLVAAREKLEKNARKYPTEQVRGSSKKYTEY